MFSIKKVNKNLQLLRLLHYIIYSKIFFRIVCRESNMGFTYVSTSLKLRLSKLKTTLARLKHSGQGVRLRYLSS